MSNARELAELGGSYGQGGFVGMKNRIINGAMMIDQRNAGAAVTLTSSGVYTADRWIGVESTDGGMTAQQDSSAPAGFVNSLKLTTTTADASLSASQYVAFQQRIEGTNVADLGWGTANAKTVTISFWVRSSLTGTFGGALRNSSFNRGYPFSYTISTADTWEYKTVTIAGDTSGTWLTTTGVGITLSFSLGSGSDFTGTSDQWAAGNLLAPTGATSVVGTNGATFYITGVQLEKGSTATSFDYREYGEELRRCQRYGESVIAGYTVQAAGAPSAGNQQQISGSFATTKRSTPTMSFISGTAWQYYNGSAYVDGTTNLSATINSWRASINSGANNAVILSAVSGRDLFASAEL